MTSVIISVVHETRSYLTSALHT